MADIVLAAAAATPTTPASGSDSAYFDSITKKLASVNDAGLVANYDLSNGNSAQQSLAAADTYVAGCSLAIPIAKVQVGSWFRFVVNVTKNATGTSTPILNVRFGTAGAVGDTARLTFTFAASTAATDNGTFEVWVNVVTIGGSGTIQGTCRLIKGNTTNTGFSAATAGTQVQLLNVTSGSFDTTVASSVIGISINPGTGTYTVLNASVEAGKL